MANFTHRASYDHLLNDRLRGQLSIVTISSCYSLKLGYQALQDFIGLLLSLPGALNFHIFVLDPFIIVSKECVLNEGFLGSKFVHLEDLI